MQDSGFGGSAGDRVYESLSRGRYRLDGLCVITIAGLAVMFNCWNGNPSAPFSFDCVLAEVECRDYHWLSYLLRP